ncbi:MFS transporter [Crossiella sp. CA-258035]|uniref:MFS transporter n=1 Tax=Crossiella sp. CA-258035 TaxID=2981138 RepID=UPI0024BC7E73|nr:MFS transporter [Crossiella sp. CA-258035]WHT21549.1 MFS transporter [Crossiella sp. CA-258035]
MTAQTAAKVSLVPIYLAVFGVFTGQQILAPVLPPLARDLGLSEVQLGLVFSVAATMVVLASGFWGRQSESRGRKPVLLACMAAATAGLLIFAVIAQLGLAKALPVTAVFVLVLVFRSLFFGFAWAGVPVAAQSYVADVTEGERERVQGIAKTGAAQGLSLVLGPALGGLLAFGGLLVPMYAAPVIIAVFAVLVWLRLPREQRHADRPEPPKLSPFDNRLWPFLLTGFGLYLSLGVMQITVGFLLQDQLQLSSQDTATLAGAAMLCAGLPFLLTQAAAVPRLGWSPARLMRSGIPLAALGFLGVAVSSGLTLILLGLAVVGLGLGLAMPGCTAAPTLLVSRAEQSGVAGLVGATNALTFVVGPLIGATLYRLGPSLPYLSAATVLALLFVFVLLHPATRAVKRTS